LKRYTKIDMNNKSSTTTLDRPSRVQVFEKARESAITLLNLRDVLTDAELETLEILLDKETLNQLTKSFSEAEKGKLEPIENILK